MYRSKFLYFITFKQKHAITRATVFTYWCFFVMALLYQPNIAKAIDLTNKNIEQNISHRVLKNGLKVFVKEDHRAPVVVSQIWYKVGSSYESDGVTGVSHALEHMMFKGTTKYPGDAFNKIISANGGEDNAFTSRDYTAYYQTLEKSRLDVSFKLESDRMRNLILTETDFLKEIKVVQEERRWRTEDKPTALVYEQLYVTAFDNSGYHHPVIGWMDDLQSMNITDLKKWYETFYSPNNAILVVVGDVNTKDVMQMIEKYFADIKSSDLQQIKKRTERKQRSIKQVTLKIPAKVPYITMGYKVPSIKTAEIDWEPYALDLMAGILDGGDSTRFHQNLVINQEVAVSAGTGYSSGARMETLFEVDAIPSSGKSIEVLYDAIMAELQGLKDQLVSIEELDRVKNQIIASAVFEKDSIFYQALKIGQSEATGIGWEVEENYVQRIKEITPQQIQQVAQKYLVAKGKTIAILEPQADTK
ncbi:MAG: pitrilysin family protein [Pseudomonadota bacterium]